MAEGEDPFAFKEPVSDYNLDNDDDDKQEANTTRPFQPGASSTPYYAPEAYSTPYHGGEKHEMQTMMHEQSGLPYDEETTSLLGPQVEAQNSWDALTRLFPRASPIDLENSYNSKSGRLQVKKSGFGKKSYPLFTKDSRTGQDRLNPQLTKEIKAALGKPAEEIIGEDRDSIREQRQRLAEAEQQQRQAEDLAVERKKNARETQDLSMRLKIAQARIDSIQESYGDNIESEVELNRLKMLKKNYESDLEKKKEELGALEKQLKDKDEIKKKVAREREKLAEIERERNMIEERLNSTKRTDELEDDEARLKRLNEEDKAVIDDIYASELEKEAARERMADRDEELLRLQTQISERENSLSLRERIKEIFKKYGVTVTAIVLAAGVTIGAVVSTITNALKKLGTDLANGLKNIGAKAASALPGLIGSIVSFLFKAAGRTVGFLAEHTWLLILAVVVFLFQKLMKKR